MSSPTSHFIEYIGLLHLISQIFTWKTLGDIDLQFPIMLVSKNNAVEEETRRDKWLYHKHNECIHVTNGVTVVPLSVSLLQNISAVAGCLCQIVLNRKSLCKFKSYVKFCVEAEQYKRNCAKWDPAVTGTTNCGCSALWSPMQLWNVTNYYYYY